MRRRTVGVRRVWRRRQVAARHSPPSVSRAPAACGQGTRSAFPRRKLAVACCAYVSLGGRVADLHMCVNVAGLRSGRVTLERKCMGVGGSGSAARSVMPVCLVRP